MAVELSEAEGGLGVEGHGDDIGVGEAEGGVLLEGVCAGAVGEGESGR